MNSIWEHYRPVLTFLMLDRIRLFLPHIRGKPNLPVKRQKRCREQCRCRDLRWRDRIHNRRHYKPIFPYQLPPMQYLFHYSLKLVDSKVLIRLLFNNKYGNMNRMTDFFADTSQQNFLPIPQSPAADDYQIVIA